jgi:3-dehydroquinate synthase
VVCDLDAFSTLQDTAFADGVSEAVKYAVVFDPELFVTIEKGLHKTDMPAHPVARCVNLKNHVVSADEFDHADRQLLNFGHTVGHAIEKLSGYTVSHGQAVAAGMVVMTRAAENYKICQRPFSQRLGTLLDQYALPVRCKYSADELAEAALSDKKRRGDSITLIVPQQLGHCVLHTVAASSLKEFFAAGLFGQ